MPPKKVVNPNYILGVQECSTVKNTKLINKLITEASEDLGLIDRMIVNFFSPESVMGNMEYQEDYGGPFKKLITTAILNDQRLCDLIVPATAERVKNLGEDEFEMSLPYINDNGIDPNQRLILKIYHDYDGTTSSFVIKDISIIERKDFPSTLCIRGAGATSGCKKRTLTAEKCFGGDMEACKQEEIVESALAKTKPGPGKIRPKSAAAAKEKGESSATAAARKSPGLTGDNATILAKIMAYGPMNILNCFQAAAQEGAIKVSDNDGEDGRPTQDEVKQILFAIQNLQNGVPLDKPVVPRPPTGGRPTKENERAVLKDLVKKSGKSPEFLEKKVTEEFTRYAVDEQDEAIQQLCTKYIPDKWFVDDDVKGKEVYYMLNETTGEFEPLNQPGKPLEGRTSLLKICIKESLNQSATTIQSAYRRYLEKRNNIPKQVELSPDDIIAKFASKNISYIYEDGVYKKEKKIGTRKMLLVRPYEDVLEELKLLNISSFGIRKKRKSGTNKLAAARSRFKNAAKKCKGTKNYRKCMSKELKKKTKKKKNS